MNMTMNTQMDAYALYCEKYGEKINQLSEVVGEDEAAYLVELFEEVVRKKSGTITISLSDGELDTVCDETIAFEGSEFVRMVEDGNYNGLSFLVWEALGAPEYDAGFSEDEIVSGIIELWAWTMEFALTVTGKDTFDIVTHTV